MIKEFNRINGFINEIVDHHKSGNSEAEFKNQNAILDKLFVNLQERLEHLISEQETQEKLILFVHYIQVRLTTLADSLEGKGNSPVNALHDTSDPIQQILMRVRVKIIEVLQYLHLYFTVNFDLFTNLPTCFFYTGNHGVEEYDLIISGLTEKNINTDLISILKTYLNCFAEACDFSIKTWHQYDYLIDLSAHIRHFSKQPSSGDDTFKLILLLISHNFNSVYFYDFMLDYIEKRTNMGNLYEEHETGLADLLKTIENLRQENKYGFNPEVPLVQESLSAAIRRDLNRLTQMNNVYLQDSSRGESKSKDFYFEVAGTIEDLFFSLSILMDLGLVKTKFKASLYTFVENHIKTERTKTPSAQYMRNVFSPGKEISPRIVKKNRNTLMTIVNYIDTHFRDQLKFCLALICFFSN